jgi:DNA ligase-1
MKRFVELLNELAPTVDPSAQEEVLAAFLRTVPSTEGEVAMCLLAGMRPRRCITAAELRMLAGERGDLPSWLVDLCVHTAGDTAEAVALVIPPASVEHSRSLSDLIRLIGGLRQEERVRRREALGEVLSGLSISERVLLCRLAMGTFKPKVSRLAVFRALARQTGLAESDVAHRLASFGTPGPLEVSRHFVGEAAGDAPGPPYPFFSMTVYRGDMRGHGDPAGLHATWMPGGRRCQLIRRGGAASVWTDTLECVSKDVSRIIDAAATLPDGTVIDGFLLPDKEAVRFSGFDLLEHEGVDIRALSPGARYDRLARIVSPGGSVLCRSECLTCTTPEDTLRHLAEARARGFGGILLGTGWGFVPADSSPSGWLLLMPDPLMLDVVLLYAGPGGAWTFGVRDGERWLPVAKVDAHLSDTEMHEIDAFVRANTVERFGPVRTVPPVLIFTLAFDGIRAAPRRRSGFTLVNPVLRARRRDADAAAAATLEDLRRLHDAPGHCAGAP